MKRRLGRTGYEVLPLGLGGHTYPIGDGPDCFATPEERAALVQQLVQAGLNYFDTTWMNEVEDLADAFRRADTGRDAVVSMQYVDGLSDENWRANLRCELESRLAVMGYTTAPLFLMGVGNAEPSFGELVAGCEAMARLREEGLIAHIGLSCHRLAFFPLLARLIAETDLVDYLMVRFNWKHQDAAQELFPVAVAHDVGIVAMKVFCWDCGHGQWGRRISVFEPVCQEARDLPETGLTPAQRNLVWTLQNSPCAVAVPAMNSPWEVRENLSALQALGSEIDTSDFPLFADRLWSPEELRQLAENADSQTIRDRARALCP